MRLISLNGAETNLASATTVGNANVVRLYNTGASGVTVTQKSVPVSVTKTTQNNAEATGTTFLLSNVDGIQLGDIVTGTGISGTVTVVAIPVDSGQIPTKNVVLSSEQTLAATTDLSFVQPVVTKTVTVAPKIGEYIEKTPSDTLEGGAGIKAVSVAYK